MKVFNEQLNFFILNFRLIMPYSKSINFASLMLVLLLIFSCDTRKSKTSHEIEINVVTTSNSAAGTDKMMQISKPARSSSSVADWTVLIFMNGDNNLENDALQDFAEMAQVGSTAHMNVIVQLDRSPAGDNAPNIAEYKWDRTLRFKMTPGLEPRTDVAVQDMGELNMGDPNVLKSFVSWGKDTYPAQNYMLIVWNHGQGWRLMLAQAQKEGERAIAAKRAQMAQEDKMQPAGDVQSTRNADRLAPPDRLQSIIVPNVSTVKSISNDDTDKDVLYNSEMQNALSGSNLAVIGFDACLMSMVETAYALRKVAQVMVASEELEPGTGWQYDDWLGKLAANPSVDAKGLGEILVRSYEEQNQSQMTLAAVNLNKIEQLAASLSSMSEFLNPRMPAFAAILKSARTSCEAYAPREVTYISPGVKRPRFQHIDLGRFCSQAALLNTDPEFKRLLTQVQGDIRSCVLRSYASDDRKGRFGSSGLAIYYPERKLFFENDDFGRLAYLKSNDNYPVEFVATQKWPDFLQQYFAVTP
jgi:hypothetical protein